MTIEQGDAINTLYKQYKFQIDSLKVNAQANRLIIDSLQNKCDSLGRKLYDAMQYKWKYEANRDIFFRRESSIDTMEKYHLAQKIILIAIILVQFQSLK
jgi:hypothetical protein